MKTGVEILCYNIDGWILKTIDNCGPHVDYIYLSYSDKPWTYNLNARSEYSNKSDLNIIKQSKYIDKIRIILGNWEREEDQRNDMLHLAKKEGVDILFIQDADEFYHHQDYDKMIHEISNNIQYDYYLCPWICFWKSFNHFLSQNGNITEGCPTVAVNLNRNCKFDKKRICNGNGYELSSLCYHGSYVMSDDEVYEKIHTWGHSHEFDREKWFNNKWLPWTPEMTDLHPINPSAWKKAFPFHGSLPKEIKDMI